MMSSAADIRRAIYETLPADTSYSGSAPPLKHLYIPPAHLKALRPESLLVVGTRGVGKSVWTAALGDPALRKVLGSSIPQLDITDIHIGFSERPQNDAYPDSDTFSHLVKSVDAYDIWRTIVISGIGKLTQQPLLAQQANWSQKVSWVQQHPEEIAATLSQANQSLEGNGRYALILFDALDRLSTDWSIMDNIVRGLLRVVLWLKPYSRLTTKVFLREDQLERTVTDFPDASKLLATKAELSWARHDLHGLLWQYLINGETSQGDVLRECYERTLNKPPEHSDSRFVPHDDVKRETPSQRELFEALAGPWMGKDRRRGVPYVWAVSHLADGKGRTSPRSFLAAIRQAAEDSMERYPDYTYSLHYESIKRGVQKASEIRVSELTEDYPWVSEFLTPLNGLNVPIDFSVIQQRWDHSFPQGMPENPNKLPPQHAQKGWPGLKLDLLRIGVFEERNSERIDMPDLYRVGFGLGRKGGVKPQKS
ncbi:hypothetical protein [Dickeya sp. NCPPB 3274]|uniref:hypothetical protein n=1 Tax=Dickeya sp. NCPPB 3274 TaxID=568766 RepID=UPI0005B31509|nr:hypothetical protein [Dickeya sp. NCPPB 3274]